MTTRTPTATAALAHIRAILAETGATVHGPGYWEDRGIRISRPTPGHAVAHCSTCYTAAKRGGFTEADAQRQAWHAEGFQHDVEQSAETHYDTTHSMEASR